MYEPILVLQNNSTHLQGELTITSSKHHTAPLGSRDGILSLPESAQMRMARMKTNTARSGKVAAMIGVAGLLAAVLPMVAQAEAVTFDWVPISEQPASGLPASGPSTAHGSITLDIPGWGLATIT